MALEPEIGQRPDQQKKSKELASPKPKTKPYKPLVVREVVAHVEFPQRGRGGS